jgi:hypothetical protein
MDACHILLGRLWQFDRRTFYDGFKNTYSFEKDGAKVTLAPLRMFFFLISQYVISKSAKGRNP